MITASVVLYNTNEEDISGIISSYEPCDSRLLYIIDNSSEISEYCMNLMHRNIEYTFIGNNIGYGSAHNIGILKAIENASDYHIVLNPDVRFDSSIIGELIEYAERNKDVVYIMPRVIYPNGELQYLCKLLPTPFDLINRRFLPQIGILKRINDRYTLKETGYNHIMNPPCLSGCFMFMRTSTLRKNSIRFDERFFMYFEDFDIIRRLHVVGKTIYYPYVEIVHKHNKTSYKNFGMMCKHAKSACKYFNKYGWIVDFDRKKYNKEMIEHMNGM